MPPNRKSHKFQINMPSLISSSSSRELKTSLWEKTDPLLFEQKEGRSDAEVWVIY